MAKQSRGAVPATETGVSQGREKTYKGTRNFDRMPKKGGRNATTNESRRGAGGIAPKPSGGTPILGNDRPSSPVGASMARVKGVGSSTPVQNNAQANLTGQSVGQAEVLPRGNSNRIGPQTRTSVVGNPVATNKSNRRGKGAAFYGEF